MSDPIDQKFEPIDDIGSGDEATGSSFSSPSGQLAGAKSAKPKAIAKTSVTPRKAAGASLGSTAISTVISAPSALASPSSTEIIPGFSISFEQGLKYLESFKNASDKASLGLDLFPDEALLLQSPNLALIGYLSNLPAGGSFVDKFDYAPSTVLKVIITLRNTMLQTQITNRFDGGYVETRTLHPENQVVMYYTVLINKGTLSTNNVLTELFERLFAKGFSKLLSDGVQFVSIQLKSVYPKDEKNELSTYTTPARGKNDHQLCVESDSLFCFELGSALLKGGRGDFTIGLPWVPWNYGSHYRASARFDKNDIVDVQSILSKPLELGNNKDLLLGLTLESGRKNPQIRYWPVTSVTVSGFLLNRKVTLRDRRSTTVRPVDQNNGSPEVSKGPSTGLTRVNSSSLSDSPVNKTSRAEIENELGLRADPLDGYVGEVFFTDQNLEYLANPDRNSRVNSERQWARVIKRFYDNCCLISNKRSTDDELAAHHLYSKTTYPARSFLLCNGIPMDSRIHKAYHSAYPGPATVGEFLNFLETIQSVGCVQLSPDSEDKIFVDKEDIDLLIQWVNSLNSHLLKLP